MKEVKEVKEVKAVLQLDFGFKPAHPTKFPLSPNSTILTSWDLGMGILLGGIVAEHFGYDATFWMMVAAHVCGLLSFVLVTKKLFGHCLDVLKHDK